MTTWIAIIIAGGALSPQPARAERYCFRHEARRNEAALSVPLRAGPFSDGKAQGRLTSFWGEIEYDPARPENSRATLEADLASLQPDRRLKGLLDAVPPQVKLLQGRLSVRTLGAAPAGPGAFRLTAALSVGGRRAQIALDALVREGAVPSFRAAGRVSRESLGATFPGAGLLMEDAVDIFIVLTSVVPTRGPCGP